MVVRDSNMSTAIVHSVNLISSTKDSLHVGWDVYESYFHHVQGFRIRYQAEGSNIIQYSEMLNPDKDSYDIEQLHENTYYKVCVDVYTNITDNPDLLHHPCIRATTSVDSLSVALGSTFGAFLALGIIVLFVFVAKWQHTRKLKKHLASMSPGDDVYDSMCQPDNDIEMSDVSMQVQDGTVAGNGKADSGGTKVDKLLQNGEVADGQLANKPEEDEADCDGEEVLIDEDVAADMVPAMVTVGADGGMFVVPIDEAGNLDESVMYPMDPTELILVPPEQQAMLPQKSQQKAAPKPTVTPPAIDPPPKNLKKRSSREAMLREGTSSSNSTPNSTSQPVNGSQRKDYGGARPKEYSANKYSPQQAQQQQLINIETEESPAAAAGNNYNWPHWLCQRSLLSTYLLFIVYLSGIH